MPPPKPEQLPRREREIMDALFALGDHATAEAIRWLEWGMRSYQNYALGLAVLLVAIAVARTAAIPRLIAYLMGLSGLTYLWQGWLAGSEGFSPMHSIAIVLAEVLNLTWMIWLLVIARGMQNLEPASPMSVQTS